MSQERKSHEKKDPENQDLGDKNFENKDSGRSHENKPELTSLPDNLLRIVSQYATQNIADYVKENIHTELLEKENSKRTDILASYCYSLFVTGTQNGVSCALNSLDPKDRIALLKKWLPNHPLLVFYYADPGELNFVDVYKLHQDLQKNEVEKSLPQSFIHAVKVKLNIYKKSIEGTENVRLTKEIEELMKKSTLHLNFRGIQLSDYLLDIMKDMDLSELDFTSSIFTSTGKINNTTFSGSDFTHATMGGKFVNCDFSKCNFKQTEMKLARIDSSKFLGSRFDNAKVDTYNLDRGNDFSKAYYDKAFIKELIEHLNDRDFLLHDRLFEECNIDLQSKEKTGIDYDSQKKLLLKSFNDKDIVLLFYLYHFFNDEKNLRDEINKLTVVDVNDLSPHLKKALKTYMSPKKLAELLPEEQSYFRQFFTGAYNLFFSQKTEQPTMVTDKKNDIDDKNDNRA